VIAVKTLKELREENSKDKLLITGMEEEPVEMHNTIKQRDLDTYNNFIKPAYKKAYNKYILKDSFNKEL
jgi:hypothetical protein